MKQILLVFYLVLLSFFTPLIFGMIGLHLIRIEFSGIKILDELNKNINTNNFNAALKYKYNYINNF